MGHVIIVEGIGIQIYTLMWYCGTLHIVYYILEKKLTSFIEKVKQLQINEWQQNFRRQKMNWFRE